jgi:glutamate N-acetyltransferase/amino-acid N-acetyltransferase
MDKIEAGMVKAVRGLSRRGGAKAARAIMTTDLAPKEAAVEFTLGTSKVRIGGMAKGSGMIAPNMATMLSVITTDAQVPARDLAACLRHAADRSFNCITVDGDSSTNDTVFLLATGAAMRKPIAPEDLRRFRSALTGVSTDLAHQIVADGEGATHFVTVTVRGAASREDALAVAKTIANSQLVKTAVFGMDPNWGRVMAAAGRAGVAFDPRRVDLHLDGMPLVLASEPAPFDPAEAAEKMKKREVEFVLHLHAGRASATAWTCDLSHDYVTINAHYHT